jgi:predicted Abi (CAAX) family protease
LQACCIDLQNVQECNTTVADWRISAETVKITTKSIATRKLFISILLQTPNELDTAEAAAYGWPANLTGDEIMEKLVTINGGRAVED